MVSLVPGAQARVKAALCAPMGLGLDAGEHRAMLPMGWVLPEGSQASFRSRRKGRVHDGVRRGGSILGGALAGRSRRSHSSRRHSPAPASPSGRPSPRQRAETRTAEPYAAAGFSSPNWKGRLSSHIRCRMTASLRATATRARFMPIRAAKRMPQAFSRDHRRVRVSKVVAAS